MEASRWSLVVGSAVAGIAALLLGSPVEADTRYWGGGSVDVAEATALPTDGASRSVRWDLTIRNWAVAPAGAEYQAWDPNDGSVAANMGTLSSGLDDAQILPAEDLCLGGLVLRNALIASAAANTKQFVPDAAAPTTLTLGSGFVFDISESTGDYNHLAGSLVPARRQRGGGC